jgi:MFS family permease
MMIATILIEAWDLYAIAFVLIFIRDEYHPTAAQLGLVTAAVQGGALIGAPLGGIIADLLGRKKVFILTMMLFIVLALAQGFSKNIWDLIIMRLLIGIPLGSDIANGYAYIMESMSKGKREEMGSRWQFMFGLGEVFSIVAITIMYSMGMPHDILWRTALALGAVPAAILLLGRLNLPETPLSLLQRGQFVRAKEVSKQLFDDSLDMLPNRDMKLEKPKLGDFLQVIWSDPIKKRATIFGWISNACQGAEFAAWGFYLYSGSLGRRCILRRQYHRYERRDRADLLSRDGLRLCRAVDAPQDRPSWCCDVGFRACLRGASDRRICNSARLEDHDRRRRLHSHVGPLLGCIERNDDHVDGGASSVQGDCLRFWLYLR